MRVVANDKDSCPFQHNHGQRDNICPLTSTPADLSNELTSSTGLSITRQHSSIPRTDTSGSTWLYPSEQMLHSALTRKHRPVAPDDIPAMLSIHNSLNEQVWQEIMSVWERRYAGSCGQVTLKRFRGRPEELSPLARWHRWWGGAVPFDRHDWVVDRCGREVRYIIDYYEGEGDFYCNTRPALDSWLALRDRVHSFFIDWAF